MRPLGIIKSLNTPSYSKGTPAKRRRLRSDNEHCAAGFQPALEFLCSPVEGSFVPLAKGIEALRKLRRVFCGRGSSLVRTTPPVAPLAKGQNSGLRPEVQASSLPKTRAERALEFPYEREH